MLWIAVMAGAAMGLAGCTSGGLSSREVCLQTGTVYVQRQVCDRWAYDFGRNRCIFYVNKTEPRQGCVRVGCRDGYTRVGGKCLTDAEMAGRQSRPAAGGAARAATAGGPRTGDGVYRLGRSHEGRATDYAVPRDLAKAFQAYRRGCDLDSAEACYMVGHIYTKPARGRDAAYGHRFDWTTAFGYFEKSCRLADAGRGPASGPGQACYIVAQVYGRDAPYGKLAPSRRASFARIAPPDDGRAAAANRKACALGNQPACAAR